MNALAPIPGLAELLERGALRPIDAQFAWAVGRIAGEERADVLLAAALASRWVGEGHVHLDLAALIEEPLVADDETVAVEPGAWPAVGPWLDKLRASPLVAAPDSSEPRPLVLAGTRLYLWRYFRHQRRLWELLERRAFERTGTDPESLRGGLGRLFAPAPGGASPTPDLQKVAAFLALDRRLAVISGGPGTGKTSTVVKILALVIDQAIARGGPPPSIALVAPTGKAAARMSEAIRRAKGTLEVGEGVRAAIPDEAMTIHRCLGTIPGSATKFRHGPDTPLATDVVVVDEASMVGLALMRRLLEAVLPSARLILLGDKDQLASVEPGAVLGDLARRCVEAGWSDEQLARVREATGQEPTSDPSTHGGGLGDCFVHLTHSYRFGERSGIGRLAHAINAGDVDNAAAVLRSNEYPDVAWLEPRSGASIDEIDPRLRDLVVGGYRPYLAANEPAEMLASLDRFRVLCAVRRGPAGVETLNRQIEAALASAGLIAPRGQAWAGQPILVTVNDYDVGLFNGDVGLIVPDPAHPGDPRRLRAVFPGPDGGPRYMSPARLPATETCFAMTVHKSQGSEFDEVAVVLPERPTPVVSRALLYTAVTRARSRVHLVGHLDPSWFDARAQAQR